MDMDMMENAPSIISPLLLRSMASSAFLYADKSFFNLAERFKPLEIIRYVLISSFLLFLRLLSFLFVSDLPPKSQPQFSAFDPLKGNDRYAVASGVDDSGIARALSQVLAIVNDVPVSSRKYVFVRSLAERLIEENRRADTHGMREVNRSVLSSAFSRTLCHLEAAMVESWQDRVGFLDGAGPAPVQYLVKRGNTRSGNTRSGNTRSGGASRRTGNTRSKSRYSPFGSTTSRIARPPTGRTSMPRILDGVLILADSCSSIEGCEPEESSCVIG